MTEMVAEKPAGDGLVWRPNGSKKSGSFAAMTPTHIYHVRRVQNHAVLSVSARESVAGVTTALGSRKLHTLEEAMGAAENYDALPLMSYLTRL